MCTSSGRVRPQQLAVGEVERLRAIAARLEKLPLDSAAEVLVLLEPAMAALEREAALALERAPTDGV